MHRVSEFGIAAHWKYKEGGSPANPDSEKFNWLRQLVEWQQEDGVNDHNDYLASIKEDLFDEEVFVFTPKGDVLGLKNGSTAIDFAYRIHSEVGNRATVLELMIVFACYQHLLKMETSLRSLLTRARIQA